VEAVKRIGKEEFVLVFDRDAIDEYARKQATSGYKILSLTHSLFLCMLITCSLCCYVDKIRTVEGLPLRQLLMG
jgi:hypothetical protein